MNYLYIVATPIGNLEDISIRALRILNEVDFILCEDTRVTKKLLSHYEIKTETLSYHQHTDKRKTEAILDLLEKGKNIALVSDAGTPGISDPGGRLVQEVLDKLEDQVEIESIPGPSAVTAALSISGIPTDKFVFMGFLPHKKGRQSAIEKIFKSEFPVVVYESKHRILKFLKELKDNEKEWNKRVDEINKINQGLNRKDRKIIKKVDLSSVVVCRELSKMHETVYRGDIKSIINKIKDNKNDQKGEFTVIIGK
jgi:16S rRNA (cytidine1402-2'-O)-methyltransferase